VWKHQKHPTVEVVGPVGERSAPAAFEHVSGLNTRRRSKDRQGVGPSVRLDLFRPPQGSRGAPAQSRPSDSDGLTPC